MVVNEGTACSGDEPRERKRESGEVGEGEGGATIEAKAPDPKDAGRGGPREAAGGREGGAWREEDGGCREDGNTMVSEGACQVRAEDRGKEEGTGELFGDARAEREPSASEGDEEIGGEGGYEEEEAEDRDLEAEERWAAAGGGRGASSGASLATTTSLPLEVLAPARSTTPLIWPPK